MGTEVTRAPASFSAAPSSGRAMFEPGRSTRLSSPSSSFSMSSRANPAPLEVPATREGTIPASFRRSPVAAPIAATVQLESQEAAGKPASEQSASKESAAIRLVKITWLKSSFLAIVSSHGPVSAGLEKRIEGTLKTFAPNSSSLELSSADLDSGRVTTMVRPWRASSFIAHLCPGFR